MRWAGWALAIGLCACGGQRAKTDSSSPDGGGPIGVGSSDAGTQSTDDCTGAVPSSLPKAQAISLTAPRGYTCGGAAGDGSGTVVASLVSPAEIDWIENGPQGYGIFSGPATLVAQSNGFFGFHGAPASLTVYWWNSGGDVQGLSAPFDGSAGALLVASNGDGAVALVQQGGAVLVQAYDAQANAAASHVATAGSALLAGAHDASGPVLVVTAGISALWVDLAHGTATDAFAIASGSAAIARPLIGGGVAVRVDGHWVGIARPGQTSLDPALPWMTDGSDFVPIRSNKAYAVISPGSSLVTVAVGHTACGAITLPGASSALVGADGTAIGDANSDGCTKAYWPALFK
jgi:hypothetical protein